MVAKGKTEGQREGETEVYRESLGRSVSPSLCLRQLPLLPINSRHFCQRDLQGVRSIAAVALGFDRQIELMGQGQAGQRQAHAARFREGNAHILDEVLDEEAGVEIIGDDAWAEVRERPATGRAGSDR